MRRILAMGVLLLVAAPAAAQVSSRSVTTTGSAKSGPCTTEPDVRIRDDDGFHYCCVAGFWTSCNPPAAAAGSSGQIQLNVSGAMTGDPRFTYVPDSGSGARMTFDTSTAGPSDDEYMSSVRFRSPSAHSATTGYSINSSPAFINQGSCSGAGPERCWTTGDCPGVETCTDPDPWAYTDHLLDLCFNCGSDIDAVRENTAWHKINFQWENAYWDHLSPAYNQTEHNWNLTEADGYSWRPFIFQSRISGYCSGGARNGLVCVPGGGPGGSWGCSGGTCVGNGYGMFNWTVRLWGYCASDPQTVCDTDADCGASDCTVGNGEFSDPVWQLNSISTTAPALLRFPLTVQPYEDLFAGDVDSGGEYALRIIPEIAPGAGDTDGLVFGAYIRPVVTADTDSGGGLNTLYGAYVEAVQTPNDANSDITGLVGLAAKVTINPSGDDGGAQTNGVSSAVAVDVSTASTGTDTSVQILEGIVVHRPAAPPAGSEVRNYNGVRIEDQLPSSGSLGAYGHAALLLEEQGTAGNGGATRGNISFAGNSYNDGHLQGGWDNGGADSDNTHLWDAAGTWRAKNAGNPTSNTDGGEMFLGECGSVSVDPPDLTDFEQTPVTTAVSELSATNLCQCRPGTIFDHNVWITACHATSGNLVVTLYDNGTAANPGAQTVYYCCFEN